MPSSHPGDFGGEDSLPEDLAGHHREFRQPLPPDDRLWRHPSEVAAAARARPTARPSSRQGLRASLGTVAVSALIGATLSLGIVAALGGFDTRVVERFVAVEAEPGAATEGAMAAMTKQTTLSVVGLAIQGEDGWTEGNAVILRSDGYLVTTAGLVDGADEIVAHFPGGDQRRAELVGWDAVTDVAVLEVHGDELPPATIGSAAGVATGDELVAIAMVATGRWDPILTTCVVSAVGQRIQRGDTAFHDMMLLDRDLPENTAGSPVLDSRGTVIGLISGFGPGVTDGDVRFPVIPIDTAVDVAEDIMEHGHARHVWLGVGGRDLERVEATELGLDGGAAVSTVLPESPAERSGLVSGDVISRIDDEPVASMSDLVVRLRDYEPGDRVTLVVHRNGEPTEVDAELDERTTPDDG